MSCLSPAHCQASAAHCASFSRTDGPAEDAKSRPLAKMRRSAARTCESSRQRFKDVTKDVIIKTFGNKSEIDSPSSLQAFAPSLTILGVSEFRVPLAIRNSDLRCHIPYRTPFHKKAPSYPMRSAWACCYEHCECTHSLTHFFSTHSQLWVFVRHNQLLKVENDCPPKSQPQLKFTDPSPNSRS